jgi:hypothetical protein
MALKHTSFGTLNNIPDFEADRHERAAKAAADSAASLLPDIQNLWERKEITSLPAAVLLSEFLTTWRRVREPIFAAGMETLENYNSGGLAYLVGRGYLKKLLIGAMGHVAYQPADTLRNPTIIHTAKADTPSAKHLKVLIGHR